MIHRAFTLPITGFIVYVIGLSIAACPGGWFGTNCEYKCHCTTTNLCNSDGECPDGKCDIEWFGPACQYQDLFSLPHVSTSSLKATSLTDRDDATCITTTSAVLTVTFDTTYPMTWIRLVGKNTDELKKITLAFNDTNNVVTQCSKTIIQDKTLDIICDGDVLVKTLSFTGDSVKLLCSLYISGGRNVALKQSTSQSSTYSENSISYPANLAVDGNADSIFEQKSCTHTLDYPVSNWNVTFSRPQLVNKYVIYNRNINQNRLLNFSLSSLNPENDVVFTYSIPPVEQLIYAATSRTELVSLVDIFTNVSQFLTLCEVEIYGDSACPPGTFGINCSKTCTCLNQSETCFVATGGCTSGCRSGYYKEDCQTECPFGRWGSSCLNSCNTHCRNNSCDGISGICYGCEDGYTGDNCNQECPNLTWGLNCQYSCSKNCVNGGCNNINGFCTFECLPGYMGNNCSTACPALKWGTNCLGNCSNNCANKTCDKRDGQCDNGCVAGYMGVNCIQSCSLLTWGENCSRKCSDNCVNQTCDRFNGTCYKGCQAGYLGNLCDKRCESSKWGAQCKSNCSGHCLDGSPCNITNGWCDAGCEPGYTQENCSVTCPALRWGNQCLNNCSNQCHNKTCDSRTGTCDHGCETGYCGQRCLEATASPLDYETGYNKGLASGIGIGIGVMIAADIVIGIFIYVWLRKQRKEQPKSVEKIDRQYDNIGTIQQNEHQYDTVNKTENVYDVTKDVMTYNVKTNSLGGETK